MAWSFTFLFFKIWCSSIVLLRCLVKRWEKSVAFRLFEFNRNKLLFVVFFLSNANSGFYWLNSNWSQKKIAGENLKISAEFVDFVDHSNDVVVVRRRIWNDRAEKIRIIVETLISNHHCSSIQHSFFDFRRDLFNKKNERVFLEFPKNFSSNFVEKFVELDWVFVDIFQTFRNVPKANVDKTRLKEKIFE